MASKLFYSPQNVLFSSRSLPAGASAMYFFHTGTTTLAPVYSDSGLTTPLPNPVTADGLGRLPNIYVDDTITYRIRAVDSNGAPMGTDVDPYVPGTATFSGPQGPSGPQGTPGINGGVGSSAGFASLFSAASGMTIATGITRVYLAGHSVSGVGAGWYDYDAAVVANNPPTAFLAADGRGFRLSQAQHLTVEQFGAKADASAYSFDYRGGGFTNSAATPTGVTDNAAAFAAAMAYTGVRTGSSGAGGLQPIHFENNDDTKCYYTSQSIIPKNAVHLKGTHTGGDGNAPGTKILFPPNTKGILLNHFNTAASAAEGTANSLIEGLFLFGGGGTTRTAHGIWHRVPVTIRDCGIASFAGNNINNVGSVGADPAGPLYGLTSGSLYERVFCYAAGNWNTYVNGSDCSASTMIDLHHKASRLGGLFDAGYFNNKYVGYQNNEHGNGLVGACWYSGRAYALISETPGIGSTTTPGTNDAIWHDMGALAAPNSYYLTYNAGNTYELSLPVYCTGGGTEVDGYMEVYYLACHFGGGALCGNSEMFCTRTSNTLGQRGDGSTGTASTGSHQAIKRYAPDDTIVGNQLTSTLGGDKRTIGSFGRGNEGSGNEYKMFYIADGVVMSFGGEGSGYPGLFFLSTLNSTKQFGTGANLAGALEFYQLAIADIAGTVGAGRRVWVGSAAPTTGGPYARGERVYSNAPSAGGTEGWVCVTTGSPGTWKAFGSIAA